MIERAARPGTGSGTTPPAVRACLPRMWVMTRTFERILTLRMTSRPMRSSSAQSRGSGFLMTSSAPRSSASNARPIPSPCTDDDTTRIGVGVKAMMRSVACRPSMRGMWMSIVTRSGRSRSTISTASAPSCACPTTSISGSESRIWASISRATSESSAMSDADLRSLLGHRRPRLPDQLLDGVEQRVLVEDGLGDVGIGASLDTLGLLLVTLERGDDDDRESPASVASILMARVSSKPVMLGIWTSVTTASTARPSRSFARPAAPSTAVSTS